MSNEENKPLLMGEEDDAPPMLPQPSESNSSMPVNLDLFFQQIYRYYQGKGLNSIALAGLLNIFALAFTIASSALCLLFIDWAQFKAPCIVEDSCDIMPTVLFKNPLESRGLLADVLVLSYLSIFVLFWLWTTIHYVIEMHSMLAISSFMKETLGVSDRKLSVMTWAEVVSRLVQLQQSRKLCITRPLDEHDIVSRIMRKDNYMIALVNSGILNTSISLPSWLFSSPLSLVIKSRKRPSDRGRRTLETLTKTIEWNIKWCILDDMFDERTFEIKQVFIAEPERLARGMFRAGMVNLILSPFLVVFLFIYFFMHNAERFYSHPGAISTRRWTSLAKWRMRELNELPHYLSLRLYSARGPANKYLGSFPNPTLVTLARFISFVAGSLAALLLMITLMDEKLLERSLFGRHLVWWIAALGVILAASRQLAGDSDDPSPYDPEAAMQELATFTHWMPRHWRGRAHEPQVQAELSAMYQLKVRIFVEEMASVLLTPLLLMWVLPRRAQGIVEFVQSCTVKVPGVGAVCSYATFDLSKHGNSKYSSISGQGLVSKLLNGGGSQSGSAFDSSKVTRARQGKVEKSLLTFASTYPTWQPAADKSQGILKHIDEIENQLHLEGVGLHGQSSLLNSDETSTLQGPNFASLSHLSHGSLVTGSTSNVGRSASGSAHVAISIPQLPGSMGRPLPLNEGGALSQMLRLRHALLSQLYVTNDPTVQHRLHHSMASRSLMACPRTSSSNSSSHQDITRVSKSSFGSSHASSSSGPFVQPILKPIANAAGELKEGLKMNAPSPPVDIELMEAEPNPLLGLYH